jgi:hypothetical protein
MNTYKLKRTTFSPSPAKSAVAGGILSLLISIFADHTVLIL